MDETQRTGEPGGFRRADWRGFAGAALLALGAIAIYRRTLSVPFLLDDYGSILDNLTIRRLWPLWPALSPPAGAGVVGRPLLNLSFAANYAAGATAVSGYHCVNLLIHILAGWTLFGLARRTLRSPRLSPRFGTASFPLALAIGAIWTWHPVQTESVTYVCQRAESFMGLCYLLTLYCFARGARSGEKRSSRIWLSLSVAACLAGVAIKEVIATAPLLVFLYDRTFVSGRFSAAWRRHWPLYSALAATWLPLGWLMSGLQDRGVAFGPGSISAWAYAVVECRAVVKYLLLGLWPHPLVFDYGPYVETSLAQVWPYAAALAALLSLAVAALRRAPALGFLAGWFFLILAPTSSFVPIVESPMAESRLYLPLAAVAALAVIAVFVWAGRWSWPVLAIAASGLGLAAAQRNQVYASERGLWSDTVAKRPDNARALSNLASAVVATGGPVQEAVAEYEAALRIQPNFPEAQNNLARTLTTVPGRLNDAIAQCREVLRRYPDYAEAHCTLGFALSKLPGAPAEAAIEEQTALRLKPDLAEAHYSLGTIWLNETGRLNDAAAEFEAALRLRPGYAEAHAYLGNAYLRMPGRTNDAIAQFQTALRLGPDAAALHSNLAYALNASGRTAEAIAEDEAALRLQPDAAELHNNLAYTLNVAGRTPEAIAQYRTALRLNPDLAQTHLNLALALLRTAGGTAEAEVQLENVLQLQPDDQGARQLLSQIRAERP